jgi:hypothetical protein
MHWYQKHLYNTNNECILPNSVINRSCLGLHKVSWMIAGSAMTLFTTSVSNICHIDELRWMMSWVGFVYNLFFG